MAKEIRFSWNDLDGYTYFEITPENKAEIMAEFESNLDQMMADPDGIYEIQLRTDCDEEEDWDEEDETADGE